MSKRKNALLHSIIALLLCFSMLIGTTFAWFTDSVTSSSNRIMTGKLDVDLEYWNGSSWASVSDSTKLFNSDALWEPGYTEVIYLCVKNNGNLALKYNLGVNVSAETGSINTYGESFFLSEYIRFGVVDLGASETAPALYSSRTDARAALTGTKLISEGYSDGNSIEASGAPHYLALVVYMPEETGNEANYDSDYEPPVINLGVSLLATQMSAELDSFGKNYDAGADFPEQSINLSVTMPITNKVATETDEATGIAVTKLAEEVTVESKNSGITATVPEGVVLEEGTTELTLNVKAIDEANSQANINLESGEVKNSLNIDIDGVADNNTTPIHITLEGLMDKGLNTTSVSMYHVENGQTVAMTLVSSLADLDAHNEFYYDPATGDVTVCVATFSEYVTVTNNFNLWEGAIDTSWYNTTDKEFTLNTADQLAGFGAIVDGTAEGIAADSFADKTVKLGDNIDLGGGVSFNPIGCGYVSGVSNSNGVTGAAFMGTFDGQGYTIYNLYQNGWELGLSYCNLGGGLFASVADATVQNLTISGANVVMECVEMGFVAGLAQGGCTFNNINIYNSKIANYQRATGAVVGEVSAYNGGGTCTFSNINIGSDVVVGSLWGDFDCPVGGVVGARWDDANVTEVKMDNVNVACRLDVYNDVTSAYQWYAYRRAGMLIGNTDMADGHQATASFLTCTNVTVYYGNWVSYHYCEFTNQDNSWCNGYPWVRVEAGENCSAYSNPRYGQPVIGGTAIQNSDHNHSGDDEHNIELTFNQLYGGGQGVYGSAEHEGVEIKNYAYSIQYINDNKVLAETFVENNDTAFIISDDQNATEAETVVKAWVTDQGYTVDFGGWVNAGSTKVTAIDAGNTENVKLFPYFNSPYTARFVDQNGNVLAWCLFHSEKTDELETTRALAESKLTFDEGFELDHWEVHYGSDSSNYPEYNVNNFAGYEQDVTIYPVYKFNGDVNLIPIDIDGDGDTDYYQVDGYGADTGEQELVEIPAYINGVPVTTINADAFSSYDDLHSVRIPGTIETINSQSFTANQGSQYNPKRDTVTLYYDGDPAKWNAAMEAYNNRDDNYDSDGKAMLKSSWDNNMGEGSRVFFLDANGKVINTGYWELCQHLVQTGTNAWDVEYKFEWLYHDHPFAYDSNQHTCEHDEHNQNGTDYAGTCDCSSCNGATRPDAGYWTTTE